MLIIVGMGLISCSKTEKETEPEAVTPTPTPTEETKETVILSPSTRHETYRPQIHYTPYCNWSNDPNGLVYKDGVWHLYYQYNPNGIACDFGGMSWGHASSRDLMHWDEKAPVLYPDGMGAMFSGCAVVDHDNKAGFGNGAILAYYTAAGEKQLICLAVSTDGGDNYFKYDRNPIVPSTGLNNFRDPKIVYDPIRNRYTMTIARGWDIGIEIWHSYNLINWDFDGIFKVNNERCTISQWECSDLLYFEQANKWVMVVSINPNGYITGSATMYFVGDFDGTTFTPDEDDYPRWLDYGADCYAGVTWANAPDNRKVMIAWMNNWDYAPGCPPSLWKSAYTLPREMSLRYTGGHWVLCSEPVKELDVLSDGWQAGLLPQTRIGKDYVDAWQATMTVSLAEDAVIKLSNEDGEEYAIFIDAQERYIYCNRSTKSGKTQFSLLFAVPSMSAPIETEGDTMELNIVVDQSSVEVFADRGASCFTNTVYPKSIYRILTINGQVYDLKTRTLQTIYMNK